MANILTAEQLLEYVSMSGDFKPVVRPASDYAAAIEDQFRPPPHSGAPTMFSTKLRNLIEFRQGEVTVWAGYNGHRKSMFLGQIIADMAIQKRRMLIMSMEMRPEVTLARIARQMSGCEKPSREWLDRFIKWSDGWLWMFDYQGRISPELVRAAGIWFYNNLYHGDIVIDSMMMVCKSEEHLDEQKDFITCMVRMAQETMQHVHIVAHCRKPSVSSGRSGDEHPPTKYDIRGSAAISDQVDNIITIWANKAKAAKLDANPHDIDAANQPDAAVTVEKQRNGKFEGRVKLWFHEPSMRFMDDRTSSVEPYVLDKIR